ncbi:sensor histidine kinase [Microbacterium sp. NPDC089987]|uniref:sensor histidine kinase n=1 Tax=Microbacterium sp. NPDC089987 TaxID=3364202 RepID=UPI0038250091
MSPIRRPSRRAVTRWLIGTASVALYAVLVPIHATLYAVAVPLAFLIGAGVCVAPALASRWPRTAVAVFAIAAWTLPLAARADDGLIWPWPWSVPAMLAFTLFVLVVAMLRGWRFGLAAMLLVYLGSLAVPLVRPGAADPAAVEVDLIVAGSIAAAALLIGSLLAARRRLNTALTHEREHAAVEQSRRELAEERTRIARELHDVVAHSMSLIQVQASTARYRVDGLSAGAIEEFDSIGSSARAALGEMRRILSILRTDDHTAELAPQRGIDDIPALAESTRRAGARVDLEYEVEGDVSSAAQIAAYRIVQESLSNALRHAPDSAISVSVTTDAESVWILVRNAAREASGGGGAGHGIRGMIERAELLGGELTAGADADGWRVSARIPRHFDPALTEGAR